MEGSDQREGREQAMASAYSLLLLQRWSPGSHYKVQTGKKEKKKRELKKIIRTISLFIDDEWGRAT